MEQDINKWVADSGPSHLGLFKAGIQANCPEKSWQHVVAVRTDWSYNFAWIRHHSASFFEWLPHSFLLWLDNPRISQDEPKSQGKQLKIANFSHTPLSPHRSRSIILRKQGKNVEKIVSLDLKSIEAHRSRSTMVQKQGKNMEKIVSLDLKSIKAHRSRYILSKRHGIWAVQCWDTQV